MRKILRTEGSDPIVAETLYRAVVQAVLLFGAEIWVLTATMLQKMEGVYVGFLRHVVEMLACNLGVGMWQKEGAERVLQETGRKKLREYIETIQARVAEWVALRPIFEVFAKNTGFKGRGGGVARAMVQSYSH